MFTGIIKEIGQINNIVRNNQDFTISIKHHFRKIQDGDSISINGVCLTVSNLKSNEFDVDVMPETVQRTNIGTLHNGDLVNLEPALKLNDRLGGHFVLGHVDTTAELIKKNPAENSTLLTFRIDRKYQEYLVEKGSITVDGVSLTIISTNKDLFEVGIIPYTSKETILGNLKPDQLVNIETDILGKYIINRLGVYDHVK